ASVNRLLCRNIASGKFVTFCYSVIDTSAMTIAYANAGHFPPILLRANGQAERLAPTGLVLGVAADWSYTSGVLEIGRGDQLICYTDGITEALAPDGGEFGEDRLLETLRPYPSGAPDRLARAVSDAVSAWTGGSPQDDATLIVAAIE